MHKVTPELIDRIKTSRIQHVHDINFNISQNKELILLKNYLGFGGPQITQRLRSQPPNPVCLEIAEIIEEYLKTNQEQWNNKIVWRQEQADFGNGAIGIEKNRLRTLSWFRKNNGMVLEYPQLLSTYSEKRSIQIKEKWFFEIHTAKKTRGYRVFDINPTSGEKEVLFLTDSKFQIMEVNESENKVVLRETSEPSQIILYKGNGFFDKGLYNWEQTDDF